MPDDASLEDILYAVYVRVSIERGLEDIRQGRTIPHAEVVKNIEHWLHTGELR
jgi:predicted transcriptional regulator